ncbi:TPA: c1 repressor inactivator [Salmonella enterica subsp. enterica serovar Havana]|uniref:C1 repressor inactivator n=1 Tax=Salmonella diarizonae TaxID=59204 RepID=A0A6Y1QQW5_SALDZ|nr:c1 repressor inactivator [Salmonella enterica]EBV7175775.1 c1 repressor inactivator [Salmonella enterica subsp. enterica serovar Thompson]EBW7177888.1 c1 repressor inactivator [Salmonella enterica subsp. enterica serovar Weltevreden]ECF2185276.1 c1 repressor inactivator [Salmonella enterica subsp. enterica serovar Richmond]ECH9120145.1 c1 repressor inactivator [Salmonella enterica subsp. enterica]ECI2509835.1 c1 repressor inactivator [Salmonella enterica subsp. enterica serovar Paratyphi B]
MAFIAPTVDDVKNYSNELSLDLTSPDAARAVTEHHLKLSNQEHRVTVDEVLDLIDSVDYLIYMILTESS